MSESARRSPLWMVSQDPLVNELIGKLSLAREAVAGEAPYRLEFSRTYLERVRAGFAENILVGEARLHRLCEALALTLLDGPYEMQSVVIGEVGAERFTLSQPLSREALYREIDLDLGTRLLRRIRIRDGQQWAEARLVANVVEYQPFHVGPHGIHRMSSRIKAEEELWNKVVDELFTLDELVDRDKDLRPLSHYIKDVFGIKIVVGTRADAARVQERLLTQRWSVDQLAALDLPGGSALEHLEFIEVKDHLSDRAKLSGWEAIKSVVHWWGGTFEIQVQPLENWYRERERLTRESHAGHKARREQIRDVLAQRDPVFAFYRDLLRWLFQRPDGPPPTLPGVEVQVVA